MLPFIADATADNVASHFAMVHLQLQPSEWKEVPAAVEAVNKEYDQLRALPACDEAGVQEYETVRERASRTGKVIYFGCVFHYAT